MPNTTPLTADQIGSKAVRFPSGVPIPNVTDTMVDPYAPTRGAPAAQVEGLEFLPQTAERYPGLILLHERWGLTSQIKDVGSRLAREGYTVLVPNLYARHGGMVTANAEVATVLMERIKEADILQDLTSCCEYLNTQDRVQRGVHGVVGFGMGGTWALRFACHRRRLKTVVAFYGNLPMPPSLLQDLACPVLYHRAGADDRVTEEEIAQLRDAAGRSGKRIEILTYAEAPHAFCNETVKDAYRPEAAAQAWQATTEFLKSCFKN